MRRFYLNNKDKWFPVCIMLIILIAVAVLLFPFKHRVRENLADNNGYQLSVDIFNLDYLVKADDFSGNVDLVLGDEVRNYWPISRFEENADGVTEVALMRLDADSETHIEAEMKFIADEYFMLTEGNEVYKFTVK